MGSLIGPLARRGEDNMPLLAGGGERDRGEGRVHLCAHTTTRTKANRVLLFTPRRSPEQKVMYLQASVTSILY